MAYNPYRTRRNDARPKPLRQHNTKSNHSNRLLNWLGYVSTAIAIGRLILELVSW